MIRIAVFASGGGTNLQALLDHFNAGPGAGPGDARVALVISDRETAGALGRAERAGIVGRVVPPGSDAEVAAAILSALREADIRLVALAGYLRLIPAEVVQTFRNRIMNIHPALLPAFGGKGMYGRRVHEAVLQRGCRVTGATVHVVDERYDSGPILAQWPVPVLDGDDPARLAARVLRVEHALYPATVEAVARMVPQLAEGESLTRQLRPFRLEDETQYTLADAPPSAAVRRALGLGPARPRRDDAAER